ncbi:MAG: hypothetical protein HQ580_15275 [Planctomycetes bacterium]|nr:hypothetical protein [Planctomycetota bacterium]
MCANEPAGHLQKTWDRASTTHVHLDVYRPDRVRGSHVVCFVGYTSDYFIVRNSWGNSWDQRGFGYASNSYAQAAFTDVYGVVA